MKNFLHWLKQHYDKRFALTPYAVIHAKMYRNDVSAFMQVYTGHTFVFIFGFRLACIQRTFPWQREAQ